MRQKLYFTVEEIGLERINNLPKITEHLKHQGKKKGLR